MSMTTSIAKRCRNAMASLGHPDDGSGSSPFTWNTGTRIMRVMSVQ